MMTLQCSICLKKFDYVSKLRRHQLTHSGLRPFTCYVCLKSFRQSAHLKTHLKSHSKLREVSVVLSQAIASPISYSGAEQSYDRHEDGELGEENVWYGSLQTCSQSEPEQERVHHLIPDNKQTCDVSRRNHEGSEEEIHEGSFKNHRYSDDAKMLPRLSTSAESSVKETRRPGAVGTTEGSQSPDASAAEKTVKMVNRHQCTVCLKYFSAPSKLERHILIHSGLRPFCCEFCPKAFRQRAHLKMHVSTHFTQKHQNVKAVRPGCTPSQNPNHPSARVNTSLHRSKPSERPRTEEAGGVEEEPKGSEEVHGLNVAESWSKGKIKHGCSECGKCFSAPSKLRRHCLIHTGQRPFQCSLCCRAFRQLSHLKTHHSVHAAPRKTLASSLQTRRSAQPQPGNTRTSRMRPNRFVHVSLARKFRSAKQKLKMSVALSSRPPPPRIPRDANILETGSVRSSPIQELPQKQDYCCSVCSKHFNAPSKLRRHVLIHTGQRPFRCLVCCRGFRQKSHLKVHKCSGGSRRTVQSDVREVHLGDTDCTRKGEEIFVSSCGVGVGYMFSPSTGLASKYVTDDVTALSYKAVSRPLEEVNQSKGSGYRCSMCFKVFDFPSKLSRHLLVHMGIKPFRCSICSRSFRQLCHLQSHSKVHTERRDALRKGTLGKGTGTSVTEKPEMFRRPGELPLEQGQGSHCDGPRSISTEEFASNIRNAGSPAEVHEGRDSSIEMKKNVNQCMFCLKTFDFPSKLSRHLLVHTGIRPYECRVCFKSFKQLSHLQCHGWIHNKKHYTAIKASAENHQSPAPSAGTVSTVQPELLQESSERRAVRHQGHDGSTVPVCAESWVPKGEASPSGSGRGERQVKSENELLENSDCSPVNRDSEPPGTDGVDFKDRVNRTAEAFLSGRTSVWNGVDQQEADETGDPGSFVQKLESTDLRSRRFYDPEDCTGTPGIPDPHTPALHRHQASKEHEGRSHHLVEPPNDLPICPSCSRCFDSVQKLGAHDCPVRRRKHRPSRSYQCAVCFKGFEAPSKLKRHYVIHTGQRPYRCSTCAKDFTQSSHLKTHMLTHR